MKCQRFVFQLGLDLGQSFLKEVPHHLITGQELDINLLPKSINTVILHVFARHSTPLMQYIFVVAALLAGCSNDFFFLNHYNYWIAELMPTCF